MKIKIFSLFLMLMISIGTIFASDTQVGGIWYVFDIVNYTATVTYRGYSYSEYSNEYSGAVTIPSTVTYNKKIYSVTSIAKEAFYGCSSLTSVTIPNGVTKIGSYAFQGCTGLISVTIPNSVTSIGSSAFKGCSSLTSVVIPNGVTSIGNSTFSGCTGLTSVTIPNSVTSIGNEAFSDCTILTSVTIPNGVTNIGNKAFQNCTGLRSATIPNRITNIEERTFAGCTSLTSVTIPNSVTNIGDYAFQNCTGLTSVTIDANVICSKNYSSANGIRSIFGDQVEEYIIGNSVTGIGNLAFCGCKSLTSVTIGNSVTSIGTYAFGDCTGLTSLKIPNSVTSIGDHAFSYVNNIVYSGTATGAPWGAKCINGYVDGYLVYRDNSQTELLGCSSAAIGEMTIPNSVTSVGSSTFYGCKGLTSVSIPNSVTTIGNQAFSHCTGLTSIDIPNSVTNIGSSAFYGCTGLSSVHMSDIASWCAINFLNNYSNPLYYAHNLYKNENRITDLVIPTGVTNIRNQAFNGCTSLTSVTIPNSVTSIGSEAFNCANLSVIRVDAVVPPALGTNGFGSSSYKSIYVPCGSLDAYKSSWSSYMSSIKYEPITYNIVIETPKHGQVTAPQNICESLLIATPDNGYHFVQWSDGNTENPRYIDLSQDTTFAVEFGINKYSIDVTCDDQYGMIVGESGSYDYHSQIVYEAVPRYGYHFEKWSDGNKENPRSILVNDDLSITAIFAKNTYSIYSPYTQEQGTVSGAGVYQYLDTISLAANAKYGYHFVQWNDGNKENPRIIVLTQDTTITAEFAKNTYTITTESDNPEWGMANGGKSALYLDKVEISATAYYGYHFAKWNDGNTQNPRTVTVTEDKNYTATFAKNTYRITKIAEQGTISGPSQAQYLETVTLTANPNYGYHFAQWSDGETVNPRDFVLTQDTTFTAEFAIAKSGTCGKNMALNWAFDDSTKTLTISGSGALTENYTFGLEAPTQMEHIIIGNDVTAIGDRAFYGKTTIAQVTIGGNVTSIGNYAFANIDNRQLTSIVMPAELTTIGDYAFSGNTYLESIDFNAKLLSIGAYAFKDCRRVSEMTCMAETTPDVGTNALSSINSYASLCVPASCVRKYQVDPNWGRFDLCELGATTSTGSVTTVTVEPSDNTALFTWPTENDAATYTLQITKDGEVFCTLVFNANGQLTGIAFAPSRTDAPHAPAATLANGAMQFTVTGLNVANKYAYRLAVTDASNVEIISYRGEFATNGYEAVEQLQQDPASKVQKLLHNGQILIQRGDRTYTVTGQELK